MKKGIRYFNSLLKKITTQDKISKEKFLDVNKISLLTNEERTFLVDFLVSKRAPVVIDLIPEGYDYKWLACMGYIYHKKGKRYNFIHTCENNMGGL